MAMSQIQAKLKFTGAYKCSHLGLQQVPQNPNQGRSCCGGSRSPEDSLIPVCTLISGICPGLVNCPRLDLKTKSELIQQWRQDLSSDRPVNIQNLIK